MWTPDETSAWFDEQLAVLDITQSEFARRMGISPSDFSRYKARKQEPRGMIMTKIAEITGCNVVEVMVAMGQLDPQAKSTPKSSLSKRFVSLKKSK